MAFSESLLGRLPYVGKLPLSVPKLASLRNIDQWVGICTLWMLAGYTLMYAIVQLHGFVIGQFNTDYLVIIIPIWTIDGLKGVLDLVHAKYYKRASEDLSKVTVIIACKDGEEVIGNTLVDLKKKFHPSQIIVASNGSTDRTCQIVLEHKARCLKIDKAVGKVRAINCALPYVRTPYVLIMDDDTLLAGARVPTGLLEQGYTAVAFRLHVKTSSWISFLQAHEYRKGSDIGKRRHNKRACVQNISGAVGLFTHKELMRQIRLHTGEFSGEDLQRTLLLHMSRHNKGVIITDSIVITQPPTTIGNLYKQRVFGWFPGQYANFKNYLKIMCKRHVPFGLREDAFYNVVLVNCMDIIRILALPIMICYPWYFVVMYVTYVLLETLVYLKNGRVEPYWVVLAYPLFGLFGLITRLGAFGTFLYRRLVVLMAGKRFYDDYRHAAKSIKMMSAVVVIAIFTTALTLNVEHNYSHVFTNINWAHVIDKLASLQE